MKIKVMKKLKIFLLAIAMVAGYGLSAQGGVSINSDGSNADASAMLDVSSTSMGLLIPRMTQTQIAAIQNPANGLFVFNITDNKFYVYVTADNRWKELQFASGTIDLPATYTIGTGGSCANTTVNGIYMEGLALNPTNTVTLEATVSNKGAWNISTNTVNGYSFSGSGYFSTTGTVQVTLYGSGTPATAQTDNFTVTANEGGSTCTFDVTVDPVLTVYNPITGETWMDRNLGATQVATSSTDADAFGYLYQWGRASEGHEVRTSGTTTTPATTSVPLAGNSWDGLFVMTTDSPYDWLTQQDNTLWQGVNGTNNPCPAGFRLPTDAEWDAERLSWSSNDASGAFASPLKLTIAGLRAGYNGSIDYSYGFYSSGSVSGINIKDLYFNSSNAGVGSTQRNHGLSVRCIKD